ncbi:hypothetical protein Y032_0252g229 [Ancylostoma ceylanicum]|uniref:PDZ domain-containing protein n=2 Tax=Ancylostoma ceylanicum TaxID=53326 RepID=A0A016SBX1_9BILA|nr:hypothetical protein Y032_0252g229 [Ancylostoma ceylanicum]
MAVIRLRRRKGRGAAAPLEQEFFSGTTNHGVFSIVSSSKKSMMAAPSMYNYIEPMDTPPRTHLKVVEVQVEAGKPLDLVLSTNLVIRTVSKYSIAFYSVLVGDQILEINDIAPMGIPEFLSVMHAEQSVVSCIVF